MRVLLMKSHGSSFELEFFFALTHALFPKTFSPAFCPFIFKNVGIKQRKLFTRWKRMLQMWQTWCVEFISHSLFIRFSLTSGAVIFLPHIRSLPPPSPLFIFSLTGHFARECPDAPATTCYNCGQTGKTPFVSKLQAIFRVAALMREAKHRAVVTVALQEALKEALKEATWTVEILDGVDMVIVAAMAVPKEATVAASVIDAINPDT